MGITENENRIAHFTSSNIYRLCGSKAVMETYIQEKQIEKRLGRSLDVEKYSKDMAWGSFMEKIVEQKLEELYPFQYTLISDVTFSHPEIKGWSGSPDYTVNGLKASEQKSYQPKNFALYTDALLKQDLEYLKKYFPKEYWQVISNCEILKLPTAELISFCPYKSELNDIREKAEEISADSDSPWKYRFIYESHDCELAYIPDGGYYKNLNIFEFKVPENDIDFLTEKVKSAILLL